MPKKDEINEEEINEEEHKAGDTSTTTPENPDKGKKDGEEVNYSPEDILEFTTKAKELAGNTSTKDLMKDLDSITADVTLAEKGLATIEGLSFGKIIGSPLNASISAQTDAAKSTLQFINDIGLVNGKDGTKQVALISLEFMQLGKKVKMQIPLLTLVPIPNISIDTIKYDFKIKIDTSSSVTLTAGTTDSFSAGYGLPSTSSGDSNATEKKDTKEDKKESTEKKASSEAKPSPKASFSTSISSKKDSKATRESKYSVETTMDLSVTAKQGDMPGGVARMLDVLNNAVDIIDPRGELTVSSSSVKLVDGKGETLATYRNGEGIYQASEIKCEPSDKVKITVLNDDNSTVKITFSNPGTYLVYAGIRRQEVVASASAPKQE